MKIFAMVGSPRKKSNTDILVDEVFKGFKERGCDCDKIYLYKYKISPCVDCRKCKKGDLVCTLKDDMQEIYPKMNEANIIIFGTPNYWYGPTAMTKLVIDRMRPYITNGKLRGKKAIVVTPCKEGPSVCDPMIEMFHMGFDYIGVELAGKVLSTAYEKGEIRTTDQEALTNAYNLGLSLGKKKGEY